MITEPQFPQYFQQFLSTIITQELEAEHVKAQIDPFQGLELFQSIDNLQTGFIYLQDFFSFLKKNSLTVTRKEIKFLNKYFGFGNSQSLNFQQFKKYFLQVRNPKSLVSTYSFDSRKIFLKYIATVIKSFNKIEEMRLNASNQKDELKMCLQKYYERNSGVLYKEILKECLFDMGLYSRLNVAIIDHYVIGDQNKEITLSQLFWKQGEIQSVDLKLQSTSSSKVSKTPSVDKKRQIKNIILAQQTHITPNLMKKDSNDILTQIENIESTIKCKKEMYAQRKRIIQQDQINKRKTVGLLVKRSSLGGSGQKNNSQKCPKEAVLSKFAGLKENNKQIKLQEVQEKLLVTKKQKIQADQEELQPFSFEPITNIRSNYPLKEDKIQNYIPDSQDIEKLMKQRMPTKTRDQVLSKASSCAQLKIQQIERRVMGKISNKGTYQRPSEYVSRHIGSELKSHYSGQIHSRYSSLKRQ